MYGFPCQEDATGTPFDAPSTSSFPVDLVKSELTFARPVIAVDADHFPTTGAAIATVRWSAC